MDENVLLVENVTVRFPVYGGLVHAVERVSLEIPRGKTVGIVGESGCGKSVLALSLLRLLPKSALVDGAVRLAGTEAQSNVLALPENSRSLKKIRGGELSMIFQEPMRALFPLKTIGSQLGEAIRLHVTRDPAEIRQRSVALLRTVGIREAEKRLSDYPHQFSGGMAQRVMIAIALAASPKLLIADEPTTALDVTIQAQVLRLIRRMQRELGMSVLFITHDMAVMMEMADEVAVMYLGRIVERADAEVVFTRPLHPYTRRLIEAIPTIDGARRRLASIEGSVPIPLNLKPCCGFHDRCQNAIAGLCDRKSPELREAEPGHFVSCFLFQLEGGRADD